MACTLRKDTPEADKATLQAIETLAASLLDVPTPPPCTLPPLIGRVDLPDREHWNSLIDRALEAFAGREMEKVVLARETEFQFDTEAPLDAVGMLRRLVRRASPCYAFCFHPKPDRAFLGASPERLFYRNNVYLQSEALAGTSRRGKTPEEDDRLGNALLDDDKELREHRFVVRMLRKDFTNFCVSTSCDTMPSLMKLRTVQHLYTYIEGILKQHDMDAALIEAFHPTPAVGGSPRQKALDWLAAHEPFDRGVYAAPVGWVGFDDAEFCVGIRSGLIEGNTLALYSGAGIVPGSSAASEWEEIENKMSNFLEALYDGPV
jgi:menaquinone-specific isochorismate synthase